MSAEQRDPREAVLEEWSLQLERYLAGDGRPPSRLAATLARLDATDPLRTILPEVVEALEEIQSRTGGFAAGSWEESLHAVASRALARLVVRNGAGRGSRTPATSATRS